MRLVGGNFDGQNVNWTGDLTFPVYTKIIMHDSDFYGSAPEGKNKVVQSPRAEVYRVQRIIGGGLVFRFARPEHWTDERALEHLFGPGERHIR